MKAAGLLDHPPLRAVLALLNGDGEEARVVGGAVRNALLGKPVADYDIATTAVPDIVIARAKAGRLKSVPTGIAHGTVTLVVEGRPFEVTTLREDVETDGRHAIIRFGRDFAQDALRRDFTINALSVGPDGIVHDYADGIADIEARRVRFIGEPATRIREDYLRILRFFRFSAGYSGCLDPAGLAAAIAERDGLARLSRERVRQEVLKLLAAPRAVPIVESMAGSGLLGPLLGGIAQPARLAALLAVAPEADAIARLGALGVIVTEDAERLRRALKLSNAEATRLIRMAAGLQRLHGVTMAPEPRLSRELLFDLGRPGAVDALNLAWAESGSGAADDAWASARRFLADTPEPRLPFSGVDLMARGIPAGRPLGEALKRLQANWIKAGFPQDPRSLAALLAEVAEG